MPAQFITGIYGMNFVTPSGAPSLPELTWKFGYVFFWGLQVVTFILTLIFMFCFHLCNGSGHRPGALRPHLRACRGGVLALRPRREWLHQQPGARRGPVFAGLRDQQPW